MRLRGSSARRSYPHGVDLSGIIFVVLAVGWAVILIPMALKRHDDEAKYRPVDTFSESVRVVSPATTRPATSQDAAPPVTAGASTASAPAASAPAVPAARAHRVTRAAARRAARRRRRVLVVLLLALVAVGVTSYLAYTPWWSTAIPGGLVVAFLVVARLTVRAQQVRRAAPVQLPSEAAAEAVESQAPSRAAAPAEVEPDLGLDDTQGFSREELAEAVASPVLDEGGLWDPLPVTLPTYVNKARARRTVRTIEITGITSSGHDAADTELARSAEEAAKAESEAASTEAEAEDRRAAGA
jgi:hypothetical protein